MKKSIPAGVWPTMVTPYTENNEVDYESLERAVDWYIQNGVDGLFAVCQSSEMFFLSLEERVKVAAFVVEKSAGRVPVIASGHISDSFEDQVEELKAMAATGIDALVLITNRLAKQDESDDVWKANLEKLLDVIPNDIALGFYECPYPYKRLISPAMLKFSADTGRFLFLKDTSCDVENMRAKLEAVRGTDLQIYNANTATLLETFKIGITGYSGVMANFHPELYVWLSRNWKEQPEEADHLMNVLSVASFMESKPYPITAKYYLQLEGVYSTILSRSRKDQLTATNRLEVEQMHRLSKTYAKKYPLQ